MRILITGSTYYPHFDGQAVFTINLAEGMVRHGHEVMVLTPSITGHDMLTERNGVKIHNTSAISLYYGRELHYSFFPSPALYRTITRFKPQILHIQDHFPMSWYIYLATRQAHIKSVGTNHFMPENFAPAVPWFAHFRKLFNWVGWTWVKLLYQHLDVVTVPSETAVRILRDAGLTTPLVPISCGIDLDHFQVDESVDKTAMRLKYNLDPKRFTFIFIGRVDGEKRLDVIIRALQILNREDLQLVIGGIGNAVTSWQKLAQKLGVEDKVHFIGFVPAEDLPSLLNSADVFTMPSQAELLSIASLEAMACGRPLLEARCRALPELVDQGINGYLFEPGNSLDAAKYMALLADHPERLPAMGAASLKKVHQHSMDNVITLYENIYQQLLAGKLTESPAKKFLKSTK